MTGRRRWWWRVAGGVLAFAGIEVTMALIHGQTDELRLALVVALVVCAGGLLVDATPVQPTVWAVHGDPEAGLTRLDPRTASYLRIIESHLSSREVDPALRNRLRQLTDQTLRARHDLALEDPRAEELLGHELRRVLGEAPVRLDPDQIDRCVKRIEEL
jgi:hypothetical protein